MGYHWEVLGLEPTGDVLAIKKAYAGLLKKNRPDEQPEAYQELRQAYEWALSEAELRRRAPDEAVEDEPDQPVPDALHDEERVWGGSAVEPLVPAPAFDDADEAIDIEYDRADALLERWRERLSQCEEHEGAKCWGALRDELELLPLEQQAEA